MIELSIVVPDKPAFGAACNGCGYCCREEVCGVGQLLAGFDSEPCPALELAADGSRYVCGLMVRPSTYLETPAALDAWISREVRFILGADTFCCAENDEEGASRRARGESIAELVRRFSPDPNDAGFRAEASARFLRLLGAVMGRVVE